VQSIFLRVYPPELTSRGARVGITCQGPAFDALRRIVVDVYQLPASTRAGEMLRASNTDLLLIGISRCTKFTMRLILLLACRQLCC
jgi:hypothetical protein